MCDRAYRGREGKCKGRGMCVTGPTGEGKATVKGGGCV